MDREDLLWSVDYLVDRLRAGADELLVDIRNGAAGPTFRDRAAVEVCAHLVASGLDARNAAMLAYHAADCLEATRTIAPPIDKSDEITHKLAKKNMLDWIEARGPRVDPGPNLEIARG